MMINLEQTPIKKRRMMMIRQGKKTKIDHEVNTELLVKISEAKFTNSDHNTDPLEPYYGLNRYKVVAYTVTEKRYVTQSQGEKCVFNKELVIPLDSCARYLYIELLRLGSRSDPGTSNGIVVMGRAQVRLPPWTSRDKISGKASLVLLDSDRCLVEQGTLGLSMKLHRYIEDS